MPEMFDRYVVSSDVSQFIAPFTPLLTELQH